MTYHCKPHIPTAREHRRRSFPARRQPARYLRVLNLLVDIKTVARIESFARRHKLTRAETLRLLIQRGLDGY